MRNIRKEKLRNILGIQGLVLFISIVFIAFINISANAKGRVTDLKRNDILKKSRGTYARADVGYSWPAAKINSYNYSNKPKGTLVATLGVGQLINSNIRLDITASYRGQYKYSYTDPINGAAKQKLSSTAIMLNGYLSPKVFKYAIPYVMAGAGLAINKAGNFFGPMSTTVIGNTSEHFAWQVGLGSLIKISSAVHADIMYKYVDLGNMKTNAVVQVGSKFGGMSPVNGRLKLHELSIGVGYFF